MVAVVEEATGLDAADVKDAFARFPTGVVAIAAVDGPGKAVLVASSFTVGVSLEPPLVTFAVQNTSTTWPRLRRAPRIGVSVLAHDQAAACLQLARRTGDRFGGIQTKLTDQGAVFIAGASVQLDCEIRSEVPAGDHQIVVLEVKGLSVGGSAPLVYHGSAFRALA